MSPDAARQWRAAGEGGKLVVMIVNRLFKRGLAVTFPPGEKVFVIEI
jgi:hypothetical protein